MTKRAHIPMETKLASALLALGEIPYDHAKLMTVDQIISLYHFDHNILHAIEVNNEFWNLTPLGIMAHRAKSKRDAGIIAKGKRIRGETCNGPKRKIPQRVNPWQQGRKFQKRASA